jgi:hypothetical protein
MQVAPQGHICPWVTKWVISRMQIMNQTGIGSYIVVGDHPSTNSTSEMISEARVGEQMK